MHSIQFWKENNLDQNYTTRPSYLKKKKKAIETSNWVCVQEHHADITQVLYKYSLFNWTKTELSKKKYKRSAFPVGGGMISQFIFQLMLTEKVLRNTFSFRLFHRQWLHLFPLSLNVTDPNINLITVMCPHSTVSPRVGDDNQYQCYEVRRSRTCQA